MYHQSAERPAAQLLRFHACMSPLSGYRVSNFDPATDRGGMIAPLVGGTLLMIDPSFPVYASVLVFALAGTFVLFIEEPNGASEDKGRRAAIVH